MKSKFKLAFLAFFSTYFLNAQCFEPNGMGDFEGSNTSEWFVSLKNGASYGVTTSEKYHGNQSFHANVTHDSFWENRMFGVNGSCYFTKTAGETVTFSFYAKGEIGNILEVYLADGNSNDGKETITFESNEWEQYIISFVSGTSTSDGNVKFVFRHAGDYYLDLIEVNKYDCNGEVGGLAAIDDCGLCAGGSTGLTFTNNCEFKTVNHVDPNIRFDGTFRKVTTNDTTRFYRFKEAYSMGTGAQATSGITMNFRTESPIAKAHFFVDENRTSSTTYWSGFGVFKDGEFVNEVRKARGSSEVELTLENTSGGIADWQITLPAGSAAEFIKLEIIVDYDLEPIEVNDKPIYVAIGNSITHGIGTVYFHTHHTYPWLIGDSLDYHVYNFGIGGSVVNDEITSNFDGSITPELISVLWGYNDVHYGVEQSWNPDQDDYLYDITFPRYRNLLTDLAVRFPSACIMAILPTYTDNPVNDSDPDRTIALLRTEEENIITDLQLTYPNIYMMDGALYTSEVGDLQDQVHPSIAGNQSLAEGFIQELGQTACHLNVSINKVELEKMEIYPNPTDGILNWGETQFFELYDLSGKQLIKGQSKSINIAGFAPGVYLLKTQNGMTKILKK